MSFDINTFMQSSAGEEISDKIPQVPLGRWLARIADPKSGESVLSWITWPEEGSKQTSPRLEVPFKVLDETVMHSMGRTQPPIKPQSFFLNVDSASRIDPHNNADLGQLLAALGITDTVPQDIFAKLPGAGPLYITIAPDKKNPDKYTRVTKYEAAQ